MLDPGNCCITGSKSSTVSSSSPSSSQESNAPKQTATNTGVKRQATLEDMFGGAAKKQKVGSSKSSQHGTSAKSAWLESLTDEQRRLLRLESETMGKSWLKLLKDEITKPYFISLKEFLWKEGIYGVDLAPGKRICPAPKNIYAWSQAPLGKVRVVILGQDPYHGKNQAHGLSFSVPPGVAVPPSLQNIYKELKTEYPEFKIPKSGNLSTWTEQGVLLLNTCLTVRGSEAGSHSKRGWEEFTDKVIEVVDRYGGANLPGNSSGVGRGVVFLAWGRWAAQRVSRLDKKKHHVLTSAHPSPYSAASGFFGNNHFVEANRWLTQRYGMDAGVNWCILSQAASDAPLPLPPPETVDDTGATSTPK